MIVHLTNEMQFLKATIRPLKCIALSIWSMPTFLYEAANEVLNLEALMERCF